MELLINILGWIGSLIVVAVYGLITYKKIKSDSGWFYSLNLVGGILLIAYSFFKEAYPNVFINAVWVMIAVPPLVQLIRKQIREKP